MTYVVMPHYIITPELIDLAKNAINSLRCADVQIISVNDGSNAQFLKPLSDVYLSNETNEGFAKACNKGLSWVLENVDEDCYVVCANNDIEVFPGWLEALQEPFTLYPNVAFTGLISSKLREIDGVPIEKYQIPTITEGGLLRDWMQSGGLWCSKKSVLQKIGLFDEQFLRGGLEDVDLFLRARDTFGMKIIMSGKSTFWHKEGATRWNPLNGYGAESKRLENENYKKFTRKWGFSYNDKNPWYSKDLYNY